MTIARFRNLSSLWALFSLTVLVGCKGSFSVDTPGATQTETDGRNKPGTEKGKVTAAEGTDEAGNSQQFTINHSDSNVVVSSPISISMKDSSGVFEFRIGIGTDCTTASWVKYAGQESIQFPLPPGDGEKIICMQVRDSEGNITDLGTKTIILDTTPPTSWILTSSPITPDTTAGATTIFLANATDATSGVEGVEFSFKNGTTSLYLNAGATAFDSAAEIFHTGTLSGSSWAFTLNDSVLVNAVTYVVSSRATDKAALIQSSFAPVSLLWNSFTPSAVFVVNTGNPTYTNSVNVSLVLTDNTGVTDYRVANSSDCSAATWTAYVSGAIAHTVAAGDGVKTVCLQVRAGVASPSTTQTDVITLETVLPSSAVSISGSVGPYYTNGASTDITGTASDATAGVAAVDVSVQSNNTGNYLNAGKTAFDSATVVWHAATGTTSWTVTVADARFTDTHVYNVQARATDAATNVQTAMGTGSFTWDAVAAPNPNFVINTSNPAYTTSTAATLILTNSSGVNEYRKADGTDCSGANWTAYGGGNLSHTLPAGDGAKSVCLQVRDASNNTSGTGTDSITLDTTDPAAAVTTSGTIGPNSTSGANTDLTGTASDASSTVASVEIAIKNGTNQYLNAGKTAFDQGSAVWHAPTSGTTSWTLTIADSLLATGTYTIETRATDGAGHLLATPASGSFIWDQTAPSGVFTINTAATYTSTENVTLTITTVTGIAEYRKANGSDCSAATWAAYGGGTIAHTLAVPGTDGLKTVCLDVRDATANASATEVSTITLDKTEPSASIATTGTIGPQTTAGANTDFTGTTADATSSVASVGIAIKNNANQYLNAGKTAFDQGSAVWHTPTSGTTSWTLTLADSLFGNGNYTIEARATDGAGNVLSTPDSETVTWDQSAPNPAFAINTGSTYTSSENVTLTLTSNTGVDEYRVANGSDCSAATWTTYGGSTIAHTLAVPGTDGVKTVCLEVRDVSENASATDTDTITLDKTQPTAVVSTTGTIGPESTAGANTAITGTAADTTSGIASAEIAIKNNANQYLNAGKTAFDQGSVVWHAPTSGTTSWSLTLADSLFGTGTYTIEARSTDGAGNVLATADSETITWDQTAPDAAFSINTGDAYTVSENVALTIATVAGVAEYRKANGTDCSAASWTAYGGGTIAHTLAVPGTDGSKSVCLEVRDSSGNADATETDTITLDKTQPAAAIATTGTIGPESTAGTDTSFTGTSSDATSGVASVEIAIKNGSNNYLNAGKTAFDQGSAVWHAPTSGTTSWTLTLADALFDDGSYTIEARATDTAGNVLSSPDSETVTWDESAPDAAFSINTGSTYTNSEIVALTITTVTGVAQYRKANGSDCSAATWAAYGGGTIAHTLTAPGTDGSKTVCLEVRDASGNADATETDTITLDKTEPAAAVATNGTIGPNTTGGANTSFTGTASDTTSGITSVEVAIKNGSNQYLNAGKTAFDQGSAVWHAPTSGTTSWTLTLADALFANGGYTIEARSTDGATNVLSSAGSNTVTWDNSLTGPNPGFAINTGATYTSSENVALTLNDTTDITEYRVANGADCSAANWTAYSSGTIAQTLAVPGTDGLKTVCLQVRDTFLQASGTSTDTITLDKTAPAAVISTTGTLGPLTLAGANTDFAGTSSDATSGVASVQIAVKNGSNQYLNAGKTAFDQGSVVWHAPSSGTTSWTLTLADSLFDDGSYTFEARATDNAGNILGTPDSETITWDESAPDGVFAINTGSTYTGSENVTLTITTVTGITEYRKANGANCTGATWAAYGGGTIAHTLATPATDEVKTVCLDVRDASGNADSTETDTITLDKTQPSASIATTGTIGPSTTAGANTSFTGTAADTTSGIAGVEIAIKDGANQYLNSGKTAFDQGSAVWHAASGTTSWSLALADSLFANGTYTLEARSTDGAGNVLSSPDSEVLTWNQTSPNPAFAINTGDAYTSNENVTLTFTSTTGIDEYRLANGTDCSAASWTSYGGGTVAHTLAVPGTDGSKSVCMEVRDVAENASSTATDTITLDKTLPTAAIVTTGTIGPETTSGANTAITGTAADVSSGVASVEIAIKNGTNQYLNSGKTAFDQGSVVWHAPTTGTTSWSLTLADSLFDNGTYTIEARSTDGAANVLATPDSEAITWDETAPDAAFAINTGATYTTTENVALTITTTTGVAEYRKANGSDCSAATWTTYTSGTIAHTLASAGTDESKTVCLEVRDAIGNADATETDTITLDKTQPAAAIATTGTIGPQTLAGANTNITGTASDATSGVASAEIAIKDGANNYLNAGKTAFDQGSAVWHAPTSGTTSWSLTLADSLFTTGNYTIEARATDGAGNVLSTPDSETVTWDLTAPDGAFQINTGATYTTTENVTLTITTVTGIAEYRKANGTDCSAASWTAYGGGTIAHTLASAGTDESKSVCLQVRDGSANEDAAETDTITLDKTQPAAVISTSGTIGPQTLAGANTAITGTASDATSGVASVEIAIKDGANNYLNAGKTAFDQGSAVWHAPTSGTTSWSLTLADSLFDNGTYTIEARATDNATNVLSSPDSEAITWDETAPDSVFAINTGDTYTTSENVALTITTVTGVAEYRKANGSDCSGATWTAYGGGTIAHTLAVAGTDGVKTACLQVRDSAGNEDTEESDTITLDKTEPSASVATSGTLGPQTTSGANTDFTGTAADATSGLTSVQIAIKNNANQYLNAGKTAFDQGSAVWHAPTSGTTSWTLTLADSLFDNGNYTMEARATDGAGNVLSTPDAETITWDESAPDGAFAINTGATYTTSENVTLTITTTTGIAEYRKANGTDCSGATWAAYGGGTLAHTLASAGTDEAKSVCLQVRDTAGNEDTADTDTITLDKTQPAAAVTTNGTIGPNFTTGANTSLTGTSSDATSTVASVEIAVKNATNQYLNAGKTAFDQGSVVWHAPTSGTTSWTLTLADSLFSNQTYTVEARATDGAGNVLGTAGTNTFTWNSALSGPNPAFGINTTDTYTTSENVTLTLTDATGVDDYRVANGADCSAATWTAYGGPIAHALAVAGTDGLKTVCLQVRDVSDQESTTATDTITLDKTQPAAVISTTGTVGPQTLAGANTDFTGTSSDATSGIASVQIAIKNGSNQYLNVGKTAFDQGSAVWHAPTSGTTSWTLTLADSLFDDGTYTFEARATDTAGNVLSSPDSEAITWDETAPSGVFAVNTGSTYTNSENVALTITTTTGVAEYRKANGADCTGASWTSYGGGTIAHTLAAAGVDESKTVCLDVRDASGNTDSTRTDTITLDKTQPVAAIATTGTLGPETLAGANTSFTGTASDVTSGIASAEIAIKNGSNNYLNAGKTAFDQGSAVWHAPTSGTTSWTLTLADSLFSNGSYTIEARSTDGAGNVLSSPDSETITWDGSAPDGAFTINTAATYTTSENVTLTITTTTGIAEYRKANGTDCSAATWTAYGGGTIAHTLASPGTDGSKSVCLDVRDATANADATETSSITLDKTEPAAAIANSGTIGPQFTAGTDTTFTGTASDVSSGVASVGIAIKNGSNQYLNSGKTAFDQGSAVWHAPTSGTTSWSLTLADALFTTGTYTVEARSTDGAGNVLSTPDSEALTWDQTAPDGAFGINTTATYTTSETVALTITTVTGVAEYRKANGSDCSAATWTTYGGGTIAHTLASAGTDELKTVCLQVRDAALNEDAAADTDTITLDKTQPSADVSTNGTIGPNSTAGATTDFTGTAADVTSGVASVEIAIKNGSNNYLNVGKTAFDQGSAVWHAPTSGTTSWTLTLNDSLFATGGYTIEARATDGAGNVLSTPDSQAITWDQTAPSALFGINTTDTYTGNEVVALTVTTTTGVDEYRKANGTDCSAATWTTYGGGTIAHTLASPGTDGSKSVCLQVRDVAENESATETDTITLDKTEPTAVVSTSGTIGPHTLAGANTSFTGTAADVTSGVASVQIAIKDGANQYLNAGKTAFDEGSAVWLSPTSGTTSWTLTLADTLFTTGGYTVYARSTDGAGNVLSTPASAAITWDQTPPSGVFNINTSATYTTSESVTLTITTVATIDDYRVANGADCSGATWTAYGGGTIAHTLASAGTDEVKTVCLDVRDAADNADSTRTDTITLDKTQPSASITTSGTVGPQTTSGATTNFTGTAADTTSGVASVEIAVKNGSNQYLNSGKTAFDQGSAVWHAPTSGTTSWTLTLNDNLFSTGSYTLEARSTDGAGNVLATPDSEAISWDSTPPSGAFNINTSATYTNSENVTLTFVATTGIDEYRKANGADCSGATWTTYGGGTIAHTLASAGVDEVKTVCVEVRDAADNEDASPDTDTITLDKTEPSASVATSGTIGPETLAGANTYFTGTAADTTSGVASVEIAIKNGSNNYLNAGKTAFDQGSAVWHAPTSGTTSWSLTLADNLFTTGSYTVEARSTDGAGNVLSTADSEAITWDQTPPSGAFNINTSATYTSSESVTLTFVATTGIDEYRKANGADCSAATWTTYGGGTIAHTLASAGVDEVKTVCVEVRDAVDNADASPDTDTITLDKTEPSASVATSGTIGPETLSGANTNFTGTAADTTSGIASVQIAFKNGSNNYLNSGKTAFDQGSVVWHAPTSGTTSWSITLADNLFTTGNYTIEARATDGAGNVLSTADSETITWDLTPPSGAFNINTSATYTNSESVTLTFVSVTGIDEYRKANGADCSGATWTTYGGGTIAHTLASPSTDEVKTVCVEVRDSVDNADASPDSDTITLDKTQPAAAITTSGTVGPGTTSGSTTDFTGTASDTTSGVTSAEFAVKNGSNQYLNSGKTAFDQGSAVWHAVTSGTTSWTMTLNDSLFSTGTYTLYARSTDGATNVLSTPASGTVTWDSTAPNTATTLVVTPGFASNGLTWVDGGGGTSGYIVVRRPSSAVNWTPTAGATYTTADSLANSNSIEYVGSSTSLSDNDGGSLLANGTTYHYAVFAYDAALNYAASVTGSGAPVNNAPVLDTTYSIVVNTAGGAMTSVNAADDGGNDTDADGTALTYTCFYDTTRDNAVAETTACSQANIANGTAFAFSGSTGTISGWDPTSAVNYEFKIKACDLDAGQPLCDTEIFNVTTKDTTLSTTGHFVKVESGNGYSCAMTNIGKTYCWGKNPNHQLGDNTTTQRVSPNEVLTTGITGEKAFADISIGNVTACGLTVEGVAYCWGSNIYGAVGDNTTVEKNLPTVVSTAAITGGEDTYFVRISSAGDKHTCGLNGDGVAYCWGAQDNGRLGNALTAVANVLRPTTAQKVAGSHIWRNIWSGAVSSCGVKTDGVGYCWGLGANHSVCRSDGTTTDQGTPTAVDVTNLAEDSMLSVVPTYNSTNGGGVMILTSEGKLFGCGSRTSDNGYLGVNTAGTVTALADPTAVVLTNVSEVSWRVFPGSYHNTANCAVTVEGEGHCWGLNSHGQLGDNTITTRHLPVDLVMTNVTAPQKFLTIQNGNQNTCAITLDGKMYCNGRHLYGNVGTGAAAQDTDPYELLTPVDVSVLNDAAGYPYVRPKFIQVATGATHSCGVTSKGEAWCWGSDANGQLGTAVGNDNSQYPVKVSSSEYFIQVVVGTTHSCGLNGQGVAYCWGSDAAGQLGAGATDHSSHVPVAVSQAGLTGDDVFRSLAAGGSTTCGVSSEGLGYCWGSDSNGQVGNGATTGDQHSPVAVVTTGMDAGRTTLLQMSVGNLHACALAWDGDAYCWGEGSAGEVGNAASSDVTSPTKVSAGAKYFTEIASGGSHSCGIVSDQTVWCWGENGLGQLGDNTVTDRNAPVQANATTLPSATNVTVGGNHTCAIREDGDVYCWGTNADDQLGTNGGGDLDEPGAITYTNVTSGDRGFKYISGGNKHTCGITGAGLVYCWGDDTNGQIGNGFGNGDEPMPEPLVW